MRAGISSEHCRPGALTTWRPWPTWWKPWQAVVPPSGSPVEPPRTDAPIDALIEVDFTHERAGIPPEHVPEAADHLARLEGIRLRGLMTVPPFDPPHDPTSPDASEAARPWFRRLRMLRDEVRDTHPDIVDLSMGMSLDYRAAVEEGATMVRIGTALFGPRTP